MSSSTVRNSFTRRSFLRSSQTAMAFLGISPLLRTTTGAIAATSPAPAPEDYYDKLGVAKIINAAGTYTTLTAAVMPPQVRRAVEQAALHPVNLHDLQEASGVYLAKETALRRSDGHFGRVGGYHTRDRCLHIVRKRQQTWRKFQSKPAT